MKQQLDFYMTEFVMEWDDGHYELAELIVLSDISDILEHKVIVLDLLAKVMSHVIMQYNDGVSTTDEVVELAKVITWVSEDVI